MVAKSLRQRFNLAIDIAAVGRLFAQTVETGHQFSVRVRVVVRQVADVPRVRKIYGEAGRHVVGLVSPSTGASPGFILVHT